VLGDRPYYDHIKACVNILWRPKCLLDIHIRENGFFFFKFGSEEECNRVLEEGPWLFDGRLVILKKWSAQVGLDRDLLSAFPVWIRFPSLHLKFWSSAILSKAASV